jgi:hypothetical protein
MVNGYRDMGSHACVQYIAFTGFVVSKTKNIQIRSKLCGQCFCSIYRDNIEYHDNFQDDNHGDSYKTSPNSLKNTA